MQRTRGATRHATCDVKQRARRATYTWQGSNRRVQRVLQPVRALSALLVGRPARFPCCRHDARRVPVGPRTRPVRSRHARSFAPRPFGPECGNVQRATCDIRRGPIAVVQHDSRRCGPAAARAGGPESPRCRAAEVDSGRMRRQRWAPAMHDARCLPSCGERCGA